MPNIFKDMDIDEKIGRTKFFVAPSTSRNAIKYWDENIWYKLKKEISNG
jgi:hypothetical protein